MRGREREREQRREDLFIRCLAVYLFIGLLFGQRAGDASDACDVDGDDPVFVEVGVDLLEELVGDEVEGNVRLPIGIHHDRAVDILIVGVRAILRGHSRLLLVLVGIWLRELLHSAI